MYSVNVSSCYGLLVQHQIYIRILYECIHFVKKGKECIQSGFSCSQKQHKHVCVCLMAPTGRRWSQLLFVAVCPFKKRDGKENIEKSTGFLYCLVSLPFGFETFGICVVYKSGSWLNNLFVTINGIVEI